MPKKFLFIDESGTPDFYAKGKRALWLEDNFQPVLLLGMLEVEHRRKLLKKVEDFKNQLLTDPFYNSIYSVKQPNWFLHARGDHPEVRIKFFEFIRQLDFIKCYIIIARKSPQRFTAKHNGNVKEFYFDVLYNLVRKFPFEEGKHYQFYLSRRDSSNTKAFTESIEKVVSKLTIKSGTPFCSYQCDITRAKDSLELSVLDYLIWAVQRYIMKKERRFLTALEDKFSLIYDVYDTGDNIYNLENPFLLEKTNPFFEEK